MKYIGVLAGVLLLAGCGAPVSKMSKDTMAKSIDCKDASADIAVLEKERASILARVGAGARFIVPIGAAVNLLQEGSGKGETVAGTTLPGLAGWRGRQPCS